MFILLTPDFKPNAGGIAEYLHQLWTHAARHTEAHVFTPLEADGTVSTYARHCLPNLPAPLDQSPQAVTPQQAAIHFMQLKRYAKTLVSTLQPYLSPKSEVFIGVWQPATHFWCEALRQANIRYSIFTYGLEILYPKSDQMLRWRQEDFQSTQRIYACSTQTAELVQHQLQLSRSIQVVTPGADLSSDRMTAARTAAAIRQELGLQEAQVLLTVGRLVPRKGFEWVIRSLPHLLDTFPTLHYLIAGEGEDKERLVNLVNDLNLQQQVTFLGRVDEERKAALYHLCDLFVMPNRLLAGLDWEGFGIVFLEAGLMAKPCIGGNNGGAIDAVIHEQTGLLVETADYPETCQAIQRLLADPELSKQLGEAGQQRALQSFSWQSTYQKFQQTL